MKKVLPLLLAAALCISGVAYAAEGDTVTSPGTGSSAEFVASAPAGGIFEVTMTIKNATFNVFQFAIRFDPTVAIPVDASGAAAEDFGDFATLNAKWLSTIGTSVDAETGFIGFTGYVSPGTEESIVAGGEAVVGDNGLKVFTFRFKKLGSGDPDFAIATKAKGEPYEHAFPEGAGIMGAAGQAELSIFFDMSALEGGKSNVETPVSKPVAPAITADGLLDDCLILKINSHALVADSGVTAFYAGEPGVVPFIDSTDRTYVPLRFVAEKLGATVEWLAETSSAKITLGAKTVVMTIGETDYTVNNEKMTMDAAPLLKESKPGEARTMVPLRFVAEALGMTVEWNEEYRFVILAPGDYDWNAEGDTEKEVIEKANTLLIMYSSFV